MQRGVECSHKCPKEGALVVWKLGRLERSILDLLFGALAEFGRDIIRERTLAGLEAARRRRRKGGRPRALSEEQLPMVQRLMRDEETTTREICQTFGISRATLYRYVSPEGELRK